jgi:hypothetical protein
MPNRACRIASTRPQAVTFFALYLRTGGCGTSGGLSVFRNERHSRTPSKSVARYTLKKYLLGTLRRRQLFLPFGIVCFYLDPNGDRRSKLQILMAYIPSFMHRRVKLDANVVQLSHRLREHTSCTLGARAAR